MIASKKKQKRKRHSTSHRTTKQKREQSDGPNHHAFGTSVMFPACAGNTPEASGDTSSRTFGKNMKRRLVHPAVKLGCLLPLITVIVLICGALLLDRFIPSPARRKLPASATQIQEYYSDCWNGDFVRLIKAKLPQQEYAKYAKSLSLTSLYDPAIHQDIESTINMGIGGAPPWWNPPIASGTTYFEHKKGDDYLRVLSYSDGYVYYLMTSW